MLPSEIFTKKIDEGLVSPALATDSQSSFPILSESDQILVEENSKPWRPHKKQEQFIELPNEVYEGLYGGTVGSGKTELLLLLPILKGWTNHSKFKGIIFRRSYRELEDSLIPRSKDLYPQLGAKYNETKHMWVFPSGSWIRLGFIESDADARSHDTAEYNYVAFEQLESFTEFQYTYMFSRNRTSCSELPAVVRSAANPGGPGTIWVRERFVDPFPEGGKLIIDSLSGIKRIFIKATPQDNPHLTKNDPTYFSRLLLLPEAERKAKLGDWHALLGRYFTDFRSNKHSDEPDNALHVIDPFPIPDWFPRVGSLDWGGAGENPAATVAYFGAITPDERLIVTHEYFIKGVSVSIYGSQIGSIARGLPNLLSFVEDPSAFKDRGDGSTLSESFHKFSGISPKPANNDRVNGAQLIHELFRWRLKPKLINARENYSEELAQRILRVSGMGSYLQYRDSFKEEEPERNLPKVLIFRNCSHLIATLPLCEHNPNNPGDVKEFDGDDPYDSFRYLCREYDRLKASGSAALSQLKARSEILDKFKETQDYNYLYRSMEFVEKKEKFSRAPVSRGMYRGRLNV